MRPERRKGRPQTASPTTQPNNATILDQGSDNAVQQLRRRRDASRRLPALVCGHRDPLDCTAATGAAGVVEPDTRHAVLALARRHRFARWEVERLVGDLDAAELVTFGGSR